MIKNLLDLKSDRLGFKTVFHVIMGIVILFVGNQLALLPIDLFYAITKLEGTLLTVVAVNILRIAIPLLLTSLYIIKMLKMPLSDFRIQKPKSMFVWILCAVLLPISISCYFIFLTPGTFTVANYDSERITRNIVNAVLRTCFVAGITEELIFRGFIMRLLETRWNKQIAIILPSILFGFLHVFNIENPNIVDILQLLVTGTLVGIMFSMIAYQSGSIWLVAIVHGIWNLIIVGGILEISIEPSSMFSYALKSNSTLLTGGAFGIESSLPAIIGYGVMIIIAWLLQRRSSTMV